MILALLLSAASAAPAVHTPSLKHPVAVGVRAGGWSGDYTAPGLGGQIKLQPVSWAGVAMFSDNFALPRDGVVLHDHVIGFSLYAPSLLHGERWYLAPTLGACTDFRFLTPISGDRPGNTDVRFGAHAGTMLEVFVVRGLALEWTVDLTGYIGNDAKLDTWTASSSNRLGTSLMAQSHVSVNYWF